MFGLKRYDYTFIFELERLILCKILSRKYFYLNDENQLTINKLSKLSENKEKIYPKKL